jgi:hypothetical protein
MFRRQLLEWLGWMDEVLNVHRNEFVFQLPNAVQLAEHKKALEQCIQIGHFAALALSSSLNFDRDLMPRLQVRIRQLQDAYDTFHDETLSDDQAEKILQQVFPE